MGITVNLNRRMFRFLIVMHDIKPTIWRSIELDEDATFWDLHMAIQDAMSWDNAHLHEFIISNPHMQPDLKIGISIDDGFLEPEEEADSGWMCDLSSIFIDIGDKATYHYNSGYGYKYRAYRGGGWSNGANSIRSAYRYANAPDDRDYDVGFRLLRTK